ncbi:hypothetical protein CapIbe_009825 [Capra ibex]
MALLGMFKRQGSERPQSGARAILMSCVDSPNLTSSRACGPGQSPVGKLRSHTLCDVAKRKVQANGLV